MRTIRTRRIWIPSFCLLLLLAAMGGCAVEEDAEITEVETQEAEPLQAEEEVQPEPMQPAEPETPMEERSTEPATQPATAPAAEPATEAAPAAAIAGAEVFAERCGKCHEPSDMEGIGDRFDAASLEAFVRQEETVDGEEHAMPFRGSPEEMEALTDWLFSQG